MSHGPATPCLTCLLSSAADREIRVASFAAQRWNEIAMSQLLRFPTAVEQDPTIEAWMQEHSRELGAIAQRWFEVMRGCGGDQTDELIESTGSKNNQRKGMKHD